MGKKKATTATLYFFQKSSTAIKENTLKKFYCLYATLWGQFKKNLPLFFFFCLQFKIANNCSCILLLQLFAVAACVTSMF